MKIIGVSFFWGIAATIILSVTLFSIAIYDTAYHRIHNIIKYLFFILNGSQYQIAPILLSGGAAAVVVGTGYAGDLLAKYIYEEENKSDYIYYLKELN